MFFAVAVFLILKRGSNGLFQGENYNFPRLQGGPTLSWESNFSWGGGVQYLISLGTVNLISKGTLLVCMNHKANTNATYLKSQSAD